MGIEGVLNEGFVTTSVDKLVNWSQDRLTVADDFRSGVLCGRNDARRRGPL